MTWEKAKSRVYKLKNLSTEEFYETIWDFTTEERFVWIHIESFSCRSNVEFMDNSPLTRQMNQTGNNNNK